MSRPTWRCFFFGAICQICPMLHTRVRLQLGNAKNGVDIETETQLNGWGTFLWICNMSTASSWSKMKCFQFAELLPMTGWIDSLDDYEKNVFQWLIACLPGKIIFATHGFFMDLLIFGKHLFIYWSGTPKPWSSFRGFLFQANLNPTPSASSAGTSGLRVRNHPICRFFLCKTPAAWRSGVRREKSLEQWRSCRVWLSEDDSQDSPVPRSQENKAKSPESPCWLRGLRTSVLWHDVLAYVVEICLTLDYHCWIFGLFTFFIYHWYLMSSCHEIVTCFF